MTATQTTYDRITFSLPKTLNRALDEIKEETNRSKSEIIKLAIEHYLSQQKKIKLENAVSMMQQEYETDDALTEMTALDGEDFL